MKQHPYKLRAYHNPQKIDESLVPDGWRFRYADEMRVPVTRCQYWSCNLSCWNGSRMNGLLQFFTYIVPVV
jgi:hypothetical protein